MLSEFKKFALKGNVVDLAVGVIIGAAFGKIVTSVVNDLIMPPLGLVIGNIDFSNLTLVLKDVGADGKPVTLNYGAFINNVVQFTIVAFAVFLLVKALNSMKHPPAAPGTKNCPECLSNIPVAATRCAHCTTKLSAA